MLKYYIRTTGERVLDKSYSQINYELLIDTEHNARKSFVEQLEHLATLDDDIVILEDDLILCDNFEALIEKVIYKYKDKIINFFYYPESYFSTHEDENFTWNQCVYYPNKLLKILAKEMRHQYTLYPNTQHDTVEGRALKMLNISVINYRPCLVQHLDFDSLVGNSCMGRRSPYFVDYLKELNIPYEKAYKKENKERLMKLMESKFRIK